MATSTMATPAIEYDTHLLYDPESPEYQAIERRIVRKQDWRIMPLICLSYLLSECPVSAAGKRGPVRDCARADFPPSPLRRFADYLDRTNLGNARTLNSDKPGESLVETLALKGIRYNIIVAIYFVPCELALSFSLSRLIHPSQANRSATT